jgi:environmental stress-induced protein Ves
LLPETEEAIPAAYNADSRLSATVAAGANTVDFDLDKRQGIP